MGRQKKAHRGTMPLRISAATGDAWIAAACCGRESFTRKRYAKLHIRHELLVGVRAVRCAGCGYYHLESKS